MFHFAANYESADNTANLDLNALDDGILSIRNNHHVPSEPLELRAALGLGDELLRARLNSPRVRAMSPIYLLPILNAAVPNTDVQIADFRNNPIRMSAAEEIIWEVTNSGAGPTATFVLSWLFSSFRPAPTGEVFIVRGTSTTAAVAATWTNVTVTWDFQLPAGVYSVIGAAYYATNAIGFQVQFDGQYYRPGALGFATEGHSVWRGQLNGGLGEWGQFDTVSLPRVRVLNGSTDNAHTFYLQIVRIR